MKKTFSLIICIALTLTGFAQSTAYAISETETAIEFVKERGIYEGDENGSLNLDKSLTRAELAVILTRLDFSNEPNGLSEWTQWGEARFSDPSSRYNTFTDIPAWALPYVEYCYQRGLMNGVGDNKFDPNGKVNPKMACTVMLRYCGIAETDWSYNTSVEKAQTIGIAPGGDLGGDVILRDTTAVLIYRGMSYDGTTTAPQDTMPAPPAQVTPAPVETQNMTIDEMRAELVRLTNEERAKAGLPALEVLPELMECAQAKAQDFLDNHYFAHNSPRYGTAGEMIKAFVPNAKSSAENLSGWALTPAEAFKALTDSTEHYNHILEPKYTHIGIGVVEGADGGYWWVQQFVAI